MYPHLIVVVFLALHVILFLAKLSKVLYYCSALCSQMFEGKGLISILEIWVKSVNDRMLLKHFIENISKTF